MDRSALCALAALSALVITACPPRPRPEVERFSSTARVEGGDFPDANAAILLDRTELSFFAPRGKEKVAAELVHTRRAQVMTDKGRQDLEKILVPFDDKTRIVSVTWKVTKPDGSVTESHPDAFLDVDRFQESSAAAKIYQGKGYKLSKAKGLAVGDVVEVTTLALVRDPRWVDPIPVGGDLPFARGEVVVSAPKGFAVDFRVTKQGRIVSGEGTEPTQIPTRIKPLTEKDVPEEGFAGMRYAFVFEREPALFPEGAAPSPAALATQVHVQLVRFSPDRGGEQRGFQSFDDVAKWYRELTAGMDQPDDMTKQVVRGMNKATKKDKVSSVQRFVQDEIDDVPTFLNLAALPSHGANDVVRAKIGDAKDQASLTLALLRQLNVDGYPVLVSRQGSFAAVPDLPTPAPFNHVVVAVPMGGSYAFIDPATPFLPTGRLPGALQGQKGILVRPERGEVIDLPEDTPEQNLTSVELDLEMSDDGTVSGVAKATLSGVDSATARHYLDEGEDAPAKLQRLLFGDPGGSPDLPPGLVLGEAFRVAGKANDVDEPLKIQLRTVAFRPPPNQDPMSVVPERFVGRPLAFLWREGRKAPIVLDHRSIQKVRLSLRMPAGRGIKELPASLQREGSVLKLEEQWAVADGALWLSRTLRVEDRVVPPERYDELRAAAGALWARTQTPVPFVVGGERGATYNGEPF